MQTDQVTQTMPIQYIVTVCGVDKIYASYLRAHQPDAQTYDHFESACIAEAWETHPKDSFVKLQILYLTNPVAPSQLVAANAECYRLVLKMKELKVIELDQSDRDAATSAMHTRRQIYDLNQELHALIEKEFAALAPTETQPHEQ